MKTIRLLLTILLAWPLSMLASESLSDSIPSNYGGWVNLTDGYTQDKSSDHQKMQVEISGSTIHLCWVEFTKGADERYNIWYRRSPDLGKTWEEPKVVFKTHINYYLDINNGCVSKLMSVSGNYVHFAIVDIYREGTPNDGYPGCLRYRRSTDGGATLEDEIVPYHYDNGWYLLSGSIIDSDGDMVGIAAAANRDQIVHYLTSMDNGQTFSRMSQKIEPNQYIGVNLYDFQVSNGRWVSMTLGTSWVYTLLYGHLYLTTYDGTTMNQQQIAALNTEDNTPYALPNIVFGGNGASYNYHPQMAIDGNTIHVAYRGYPGAQAPEFSWNYTVYQQSPDFGQTWSAPLWLEDSDGGHGTIAAKAGNVYVMTTKKGIDCIYYSHDNGTTWNAQTDASYADNRLNPAYNYSLVIDPYDESGKHAYWTSRRFFYAETHDGFSTIGRLFSLGTESFLDTYYSNNYNLEVHPDQNGTAHWFLQYVPYELNENGQASIPYYHTRDICYRADAEPDLTSTDMALNLTDELQPTHRTVIPMSNSLRLREAMTVEFWIHTENNKSFQIAATTEDAYQNGSQYQGGWYINQQQSFYKSEETYIEAGICTGEEETGIRVYAYGRDDLTFKTDSCWHHVAFTYDSNVAQDNARVFMDGQLAATSTAQGLIRQGKNPISLGRKQYDASQGLIDNFTIWSRALTADEIMAHANSPQAPDASSPDCRLLLTFNGSLKDSSQYGNDGVALLDCILTEHDGISTGINAITSGNTSSTGHYYSLDGRQILKPTHPGVYIHQGKKVVRQSSR